jgi:hypothetical protein
VTRYSWPNYINRSLYCGRFGTSIPRKVLSPFFYGNGIGMDLVIRLLFDCNEYFMYEDERCIRQWYGMFSVDRVLRRRGSYYDLNAKHVLNLDGQPCQYTWYVGWRRTAYGYDGLSAK